MKHGMADEGDMTRRNFVTGAVAVAAGGLVLGVSGCASSEPTDETVWDEEADVVAVGYGMAGAATAITAHDAGAKVILLEKMPIEGGSSKVSLNIVFIPDDAESGKKYLAAMGAGRMDDISAEMIQVWADESVKNKAWLEGFGINLTKARGAEHTELPGADKMTVYANNNEQGGAVLWKPIQEQIAKRPEIKIMFETPAIELITRSDSNEVIGVKATNQGREIRIKANKGVVLTCGGFEFNETMKDSYLFSPCWGMGCPGNTGDGIKMAQKLGADLWHMANYMGPASLMFLPDGPEQTEPGAALFPAPPETWIWLDKYGERFINETAAHLHGHGYRDVISYDATKAEYPRIPLWLVFDEDLRSRGQLLGPRVWTWFMENGDYKWSADNMAEIEKGWILKGNTPAELAAQMKVDPGVLTETIDKYNRGVAAGVDEFGRSPEKMFALNKPPYYAVLAYPGMPNTMGGPRRNEKAEVIDTYGKPIPRLYSAGELGSIYAWLYQGGGNLSECMAFGRVAAESAVAQTPWA